MAQGCLAFRLCPSPDIVEVTRQAVSVTYCVCVWVFLVLDVKHAMRMRRTVICGLPGCTTFFPHYRINVTIFEKKVTDHKMRVLISSTTFVRNISSSKKN